MQAHILQVWDGLSGRSTHLVLLHMSEAALCPSWQGVLACMRCAQDVLGEAGSAAAGPELAAEGGAGPEAARPELKDVDPSGLAAAAEPLGPSGF